jgi:hypothetical protein
MLKLLALGHVLVGKTAIALGLRRKPDGWRRVVGVGLRNEAAKFGLSAFGLTLPRAEGAVPALARFLRSDPEARFALRHSRQHTERDPIDRADLVELRFAADGSLVELVPHLDPVVRAADGADPERAAAAVIASYNRTRMLPEAARPIELARLVRQKLGDSPATLHHAERLLAASSVWHDRGVSRFTPPEFRARRGLGFGHLTFAVRSADGTTDVWALAHHTGTDGAPLQEMVSRLKQTWGGEDVAFPDPDEFADDPRPCHLPGEREVFETISFLDFTDLLALRKRLAEEHGLAVPFACLFLWALSREPEFAGVKFGSTVDVAAAGASDRDVDLIGLRPADFADLPAYARAFLAGIDASRTRTGPAREAVRTAELLPPWLHRRLLETDPLAVADTFGSVGLSVLKDAAVFVPPLSDVGFPGGFISVGSVGLRTASGRAVGAVGVKGTREQAAAYPAVFRRALAKLTRREAVAA